jgi:hypothetical protein
MSDETGIPLKKLAEAGKTGTIPKERLKHIVSGTWLGDSKLKGGGHGQKAYVTLQNKGLLSDKETLKNGVRIANVKNHPVLSKREHQGQTFYPENWKENKISMAVKDVWRQNKDAVNQVKDNEYHKFEGWHDGVKIVIGFQDGKLENAYPDKWQR